MGLQLKDSPIGFDPTKHHNYGNDVDDEVVESEQL
jgi:DNA-directed RNA polymerase subunit alpha